MTECLYLIIKLFILSSKRFQSYVRVYTQLLKYDDESSFFYIEKKNENGTVRLANLNASQFIGYIAILITIFSR